MTFQIIYPQILNHLLTIHLLFQFYLTKVSQPKTLMKARQWKMSFNLDPLKRAQKVIFSREHTKASHPALLFNKNPVKKISSQKHFGMILDSKLNFREHFRTIPTKV